MDKDPLPRYSVLDEHAPSRRRWRRRQNVVRLLLLISVAYFVYARCTFESSRHEPRNVAPGGTLLSADRLQADYATCQKLRSRPKDPGGPRERNARYIDGHKPYLIRNATIWTGEPAHGTSAEDARKGIGYSWIRADVLMQYGLITRVEESIPLDDLPDHCQVYEANGRQLTSGIVDMHSHAGVDPIPGLRGLGDGNELSSDITPYVRSIDGFTPLDKQLQTIKSGGVTTSLILPGSGNNMGGEAYVIKHAVGKPDGRVEISADDMLADPDRNWRYMKMACGENPKRVYGRIGRGPFSRMGEAWYFRHAFEQAAAVVAAQDDWCATADAQGADKMTSYLPQELEWESLSALLRGQVLLNVHCYTIPDLEAFVRHTNEFHFSVRAFHHAHQNYLVPEILKRTYGGQPPAAALFADNMYYKAESYVASEQAGKILWEDGITPVYVSDNPVLNAQHVVFEAARAYRNGLPYHVALAGVTSASAELLGLGNRIGKVKSGFDADIVVWDSDPLSVGAAPVQIWIDGAPQYEHPVELKKPFHGPLEHHDYLAETRETVEEADNVVFTGISKAMLPGNEIVASTDTKLNAIIRNGTISCLGECGSEIRAAETDGVSVIALSNGHIAPALTAFGTILGLSEIEAEPDTNDGANGDESFSRAVDGLAFGTKQLAAALHHGVTKAISAPRYNGGGFKGVSAGFLTSAAHAQEHGAVWADAVALHYAISKSEKAPSYSGAIGQLKAKLLDALNQTDAARGEIMYLRKVLSGKMPLVISVSSADRIAALLRLKSEVEAAIATSISTSPKPPTLPLIILGGAEAHLLASDLASANVPVILAPLLAFGNSWSDRRALTGAPLTENRTIDVLHAAGVRLAISVESDNGADEALSPRNLFLAAGIAHANSNGKIGEMEALAMVSSGIYELLGLQDGSKHESETAMREFTVFEGNPLEIDGQIRAVADGRGKVRLHV